MMPQGGREVITHAVKVHEGPGKTRHGLSSAVTTDTHGKMRAEQATESMDWGRVLMKSVTTPALLSVLIFF